MIPPLEAHYELLVRWNKKINLTTVVDRAEAEQRHYGEGLLLAENIPPGMHTVLDVGSGAGFPGAVIAAARPDLRVTLLEGDQRKAAFLRTAAREMGLAGVEILTARIEDLPPLKADILSARALAPLDGLLGFCALHMKEDGIGLFPKGQNHRTEIDQALENWRFSYEALPSATADDAVVLTVRNIERA